MKGQKLAEYIEAEAERQVIQRLGYTPAVWYTGGSDHNDNRLFAEITNKGRVRVKDTGYGAEIIGDMEANEANSYISDWLDNLFTRED